MKPSSDNTPLRWLHLSDLHLGAPGRALWWQVHQAFQKSLQEKMARIGPPDLILMTGDLTWRGGANEFLLVDQFLDELLGWLKAWNLDCNPVVIPVPGNHDLVRADTDDPQYVALDHWEQGRDNRYVVRLLKTLWEEQKPDIFEKPFANYQAWLQRTILPQSEREGVFCRQSHFPGDLLVSLTLPGRMPLAVVGLNSTWLACRDDAKGRLEIATEQLQALLSADSRGNNPLQGLEDQANLLLMHHPLEWFSEKGKERFQQEIYTPDRFLALLCGHRHTNQTLTLVESAGKPRCYIQASSLFGVEHLGTKQESRSMGYTWGILHNGQIRLWPLRRESSGGEALFLHDPSFGKESSQGISVCTQAKRTKQSAKRSSPSIDLTPWLRSLLDRTGSLEIRGIGSGAGRQREAGKYPIETLYTPLRSRGGLDKQAEQEKQKTVTLAELLPQYPRLLIEGQPGAGKTTFLKLVAAMLARDLLLIPNPQGGSWRHQHLGMEATIRYPLFLRLSELAILLAADTIPAGDDRRRLLDLLALSPNGSTAPAWRNHWEGLLKRGEAILLLDGLDEVADERVRARVVQIVQDALRNWSQAPILVTSRPVGIGQMKGLGFQHVSIEPFGNNEIKAFLNRWSTALHAPSEPGQPSLVAANHQNILHQAILQRPAIRVLAANPVMLTCLCVVHWNEGKLPEGRARVYQAVVRWLIAARSERREKAGYTDHFARKAFAALALAMMLGGKQGKQAVFSLQEGSEAVQTLVQRHLSQERDQPEQHRLGREWLQFECLYSGIVEEVGEHRLKFWHLTFQEYLAALALAWLGDGEGDWEGYWPLLRERLNEPQWRETVALLPGTLFDEGGDLRVDRLLSRVLALRGHPATLAEEASVAGIMGRILEPLRVYQYKPPQEIKPAWETVLTHILDMFTLEGAQQVPIPTRLEAAEALGQAGDPRLSKLALIKVPKTGGWLLGKYLVTVAEYQAFVEKKGYQTKDWWCEAGWKRRLENGWENPDDWDTQTLYPNRPVVNVSWFEAMAYCRWLSAQEKKRIRLPDETLWEKACGQGTYPWGEAKPTHELANFDENVGVPTPVGLYPAGNGPFGHCDLAGNVWEWQRNLFKDKEAKNTPTDPVVAAGDTPVWRGGSWLDPADYLRAACRGRLPAGSRDGSLGFRVAAAPSSTLEY